VIEELSGTEPWQPRILSSTGATARVALVQSRASLIAGDDVALSIRVGAGAALELIELGATLAHSARGGPPALLTTEIFVQTAGRLAWLGQPLIIADGAFVRRTTTVELERSAHALIGESIVLGRAHERPGALVARIRISHDGQPMVDETLDTRDSSTLQSLIVMGDARMISSLTIAGVRDNSPPAGALQAHGPATLWRSIGPAVGADNDATRLAERWRGQALSASAE
jgi:urease accessory protein